MRLFLVFVAAVAVNPSWADENSNNSFSKIVCDPIEVANDYLKNNNAPKDWANKFKHQESVRSYLKAISENENISSLDSTALAITCGLVDDATQNFTRPCYGDDGTELNLQTIAATCKEIAAKFAKQ